MARERAYRHDIRCRHCGSNWMPKDGHTRQASSQVRGLQAEVRGGRSAAALPGADQAASGSDAHRGREHIGGGARSGRKRCIGERLGQKRGAIALERMRVMSAWRASGRAAPIVASTIALDEMWTYLGARLEEKKSAMTCGYGRLWWKSATAAGGWTLRWEAGTKPHSCACWSVCRMRSATRPTLTECMGRCRSTSMWLGGTGR